MRLLVVEDDQVLADALAEGLRNEGYAVDQAFDGQEALHMLTSTSYDCALLDVMLPDLDGFSVLRALRERGKPVAIVLLTARDGVEDRVRGLNLGADDYVVKPFAWEELSARVRGVIRRAYGRDRG